MQEAESKDLQLRVRELTEALEVCYEARRLHHLLVCKQEWLNAVYGT